MMNSKPLLPYGTLDLDSAVHANPGPPRRVRCYVQGCRHVLRAPTRYDRDNLPGPRDQVPLLRGCTYSYPQSPAKHHRVTRSVRYPLVGHPFKYESHRFGQEKSEDALTWNVFRSLQEAG